jgi:hypothetical protein
MRDYVRACKAANSLTPACVMAYAGRLLVDDHGGPLQPAPHHLLWLRLLCDERIKQLLIIAPPESAKTTWAIAAYLGCRLGFYPEQNVILASAAGGPAVDRSEALRAMAAQKAWRDMFPNVLPAVGMQYTSAKWSLAPNGIPHAGRIHPTVAAYGTGGSITGSRADLVLGDDILDEDNSRTAHQRGLVDSWLHRSLLTRRKAVIGRAILIGTAWHHDDIYSKARNKGDWVVCHTPLLGEGDTFTATVSYPDDWPYEMVGEPVPQAA